MATPHVAGVAALAIESHPGWEPDDVRKAILNTADASRIVGYGVRQGGAGLVQPFPATRTSVIAVDETTGAANLSFGVVEFSRDYSSTRNVRLTNFGNSSVHFTVSALAAAGSPATVSISPKTLTISPGTTRDVSVSLQILMLLTVLSALSIPSTV